MTSAEMVVVWQTYTPEGQRWFCPSCDTAYKDFDLALNCCPVGTPLKQGITFNRRPGAINALPGHSEPELSQAEFEAAIQVAWATALKVMGGGA